MQRVYSYKLSARLPRIIVPILMILSGACAFLVFAYGLFAQMLNFTDTVQINNSPIVILLSFLFCGLLAWSGLSIHVSHPEIEVNGDQFRLRTLLYTSQWMSWDDILTIRQLKPSLIPDHIIESNKLNILFLLTSLNAGSAGRAFIIGKNIEGHDELFSLIKTQRPNLFENNN